MHAVRGSRRRLLAQSEVGLLARAVQGIQPDRSGTTAETRVLVSHGVALVTQHPAHDLRENEHRMRKGRKERESASLFNFCPYDNKNENNNSDIDDDNDNNKIIIIKPCL